jgi:threonyl-tRNA synthetase
MLVVGQKEVENRTVAVRSRTKGDEGAVPLADFLARLKGETDFNF